MALKVNEKFGFINYFEKSPIDKVPIILSYSI
jgi:hypothetical protein